MPPSKAEAGGAPVVVITGASSGIGRATALAFAERGASLVLAARTLSSLTEVAEACTALGARAIAVRTDVSSEPENAALVRAAVAEFGRIDTWVSAASVYGYGTIASTPREVFWRMFDVNVFGTVNAARAVVPQLIAQGGGGIIIVGSVFSRITAPYVSAYVMSKHAVLGFAEVLRQELRDHPISVTCVLPATIDTPIYQHAANYTGREVKPLPPVVSPERVANAIVRNAHRPRRTVVVGAVQGLGIPVHRLFRRFYDRVIISAMNRIALGDQRSRAGQGTVFVPDPDSNAVSGGWSRLGN